MTFAPVRSGATFVAVKLILCRALWSLPLVAAVALVTACDRIVDPALPFAATPYSPPVVYSKWWSMVESCSGVSRPLANVTWFGVPGEDFDLNGQVVTGYWS